MTKWLYVGVGMYDDACLVAPTCTIMLCDVYMYYVMTYDVMLWMYMISIMSWYKWKETLCISCYVLPCKAMWWTMWWYTHICTMSWMKWKKKWFWCYVMILNHGEFMHLCMSCASRYFPCYVMLVWCLPSIFMFVMRLCRPFPFVAFGDAIECWARAS